VEEARTAAEAEKARHRDEIATLSSRQARLEGEVAVLEDDAARLRAVVELQRGRLELLRDDLTRILDSPDGLESLAGEDRELAGALQAATELDVAGELAGLGAASQESELPEPAVVAHDEDVPVASHRQPALDEALAERFFSEGGTYVDQRFLGRKGPGPEGSAG
jgi:hypothetical protein